MTLKIVVLLFDGFTMLDAVGPIEVLSLLPDVDIKVVAKNIGISISPPSPCPVKRPRQRPPSPPNVPLIL